MNERLVDVDFGDLRDGDEVVQTDTYRGVWSERRNGNIGAGIGIIGVRGTTYQRVERDPELPTAPGAVIWAEDESGAPGSRAYELRTGRGGFGWYATDRLEPIPERIFTRVHAVLRDPGAES